MLKLKVRDDDGRGQPDTKVLFTCPRRLDNIDIDGVTVLLTSTKIITKSRVFKVIYCATIIVNFGVEKCDRRFTGRRID